MLFLAEFLTLTRFLEEFIEVLVDRVDSCKMKCFKKYSRIVLNHTITTQITVLQDKFFY